MLITEEVVVNINPSNMKHLSELGYDISNKKVTVKVNDLSKSSTALIDLKCDLCGKIFQRSWDSYNRPRKINKDCCSECKDKLKGNVKNSSSNNGRMVDFQIIKDDYASHGCELLLDEKDYHGKNTKADYICSCGRIQRGRTIYYFRNKNWRCEKCTTEQRIRQDHINNGYSFNDISNMFAERGLKLITVKDHYYYKDIVKYECKNCGYLDEITIAYFSEHTGCKRCKAEKIRERRWDECCRLAEEHGVSVLSDYSDFIDDNTKVRFRCSCGNEYETSLRGMRYEDKYQCDYCGRESVRGENSNRWKGGVTPESVKQRQSPEYIKWRKAVFERDSYTCQCCGDNSGGNLVAHHIKNFSEYVEERFNIDNGITLCKNCHDPSIIGSFHYIYGTHGNNALQLEEYIKSKKEL